MTSPANFPANVFHAPPGQFDLLCLQRAHVASVRDSKMVKCTLCKRFLPQRHDLPNDSQVLASARVHVRILDGMEPTHPFMWHTLHLFLRNLSFPVLALYSMVIATAKMVALMAFPALAPTTSCANRRIPREATWMQATDCQHPMSPMPCHLGTETAILVAQLASKLQP